MTALKPDKRIKLAHVVNNATGMGGVSNVAYHLLKLLPKDRYDLYLYSLKSDFGHSDVLEEGRNRFNALGVKVTFAPYDKKKSYAVGNLAKWLLANEIELLHTHSYKPNIIGRLAALLCGKIKVVGHYHNYYDNKWDAGDSLIFDQLLAPHSNQLIAVSEAVQCHIAEKTGISSSKIEVIKNGVDFNQFSENSNDALAFKRELKLPENGHVVGVVGRISEQKAQDDFIKAAKQIKAAVPNTIFLIVGETGNEALRNRLKNLIVELGLEKEVIFTGYIAKIQKVFSILDVLVMPSLWEGLPLILVEAMVFSTAIVATNIAPISEVVIENKTALLVPPSQPSALASKVIHLLNHPEEAKEMSANGRKRALSFTWDRAGLQLEQVYEKLLQKTQVQGD